MVSNIFQIIFLIMNNQKHQIEYIFQKEIQILKYDKPGLSHYLKNINHEFFFTCSTLPKIFLDLQFYDHASIRFLPKYENNNIKIFALKLLELAFIQDTDKQFHLLKLIKSYAYNESVKLDFIDISELPCQYRQNYNDESFRKLLVQFFHFLSINNQSNKTYKFISKHPFVNIVLVLLVRSILNQLNFQNSLQYRNWLPTEEIIPLLCTEFNISYQLVADGVYKFQNGTLICQDSENTYFTLQQKQQTKVLNIMDEEQIQSRVLITAQSLMDIRQHFNSKPKQDEERIRYYKNQNILQNIGFTTPTNSESHLKQNFKSSIDTTKSYHTNVQNKDLTGFSKKTMFNQYQPYQSPYLSTEEYHQNKSFDEMDIPYRFRYSQNRNLSSPKIIFTTPPKISPNQIRLNQARNEYQNQRTAFIENRRINKQEHVEGMNRDLRLSNFRGQNLGNKNTISNMNLFIKNEKIIKQIPQGYNSRTINRNTLPPQHSNNMLLVQKQAIVSNHEPKKNTEINFNYHNNINQKNTYTNSINYQPTPPNNNNNFININNYSSLPPNHSVNMQVNNTNNINQRNNFMNPNVNNNNQQNMKYYNNQIKQVNYPVIQTNKGGFNSVHNNRQIVKRNTYNEFNSMNSEMINKAITPIFKRKI